MSIFVSTAMAATTGGVATQQANPVFGTVLMLGGFILIFYFLIWRPQSKRMKQQKSLISSLKVGDEVMTSGGIVGRIRKLDESFITLEVAKETDITFQRAAVSGVLPKGTMKDGSN